MIARFESDKINNQPDTKMSSSQPGKSKNALLVIDVGNSSTALGVWDTGNILHASRVPTGNRHLLKTHFEELGGHFEVERPRAVVVGSVVPEVVPWLRSLATSLVSERFAVIGQDLPLPIPVAVREPERVGVDRVCAAAAAYERTGHACTVVDFGTAITVDLVDDQGVFAGGAILPGGQLQARILEQGTAALPQVDLALPEDPIGRDTAEAICSGICYGIPGAVRSLVEEYATRLNHWPQVVATGGELDLFLERCDFIDSPVADLTLVGVGLAFVRHSPNTKS